MSENNRQTRTSPLFLLSLWIFLLLPGCYLGLIAMLYLDEMVFGTNIAAQYIFTSRESVELLEWIYWPLAKLLGFV